MLEEGLCVGLFWAAILHVLSYVLFCHDLLLHGVFAEDNRIILDVSLFDFCSNTVFDFSLRSWFDSVTLGVELTRFDWPNNKRQSGAKHVPP